MSLNNSQFLYESTSALPVNASSVKKARGITQTSSKNNIEWLPLPSGNTCGRAHTQGY